ncbi:MAG: glucose-6-phosphate dehydrogenase [Candidatus Magasanikbacteria bacterium]
MKQINFPTILTIFGITGDLAEKKLLPSLLELYKLGLLPDKFKVVGFSHTDLTSGSKDEDQALREYVKDKLESQDYDLGDKQDFIDSFHYQQGDFTDLGDFNKLREHIDQLEDSFSQCANKLYYLASSPKFYEAILTQLERADLDKPCSRETGWARLLIEKPFGKDIESAKALDRKLSEVFKEEQIFRIDHYLEKAMVQDILTFRFTNTMFEPVWNRDCIEKIEVKIHEDFGVEGRGAFYDEIGAWRDVGKNHGLQMLATVTMDNPKTLEAEDIRKEREELFQDLHCMDKQEIKENTIRAQYEGYQDIEGVADSSETETFFRIKTEIDNDRWRGVPITIESGKQLHGKHAGIEVHFKPSKFAVCPPEGECDQKNKVIFRVQPDQEIWINFVSRKPGFKYELDTETLKFSREDNGEQSPGAYQKVLYDAFQGDQTTFASTKEIESAWEFTEPILKTWQKDHPPLKTYPTGTDPDNII